MCRLPATARTSARVVRLGLLTWSVAFLVTAGQGPLTQFVHAAEIDFNRDVRPILSNNCFRCHGPDEHARESDLRLDDEASAKAQHGERFVIRPGEPEESELVRRIMSTDPGEVMPPPETNKSLSAREIETLRRWIVEGAAWSTHWAYVPPVRHQPPAVADVAWSRNAIDAFILSRLERDGLTPAPDADRITLLRRVCFDLTGLPPSRALAEWFLADESPEAYSRLVDQVLESTPATGTEAPPASDADDLRARYGERMAAYWLDLVRYADTVGYHGDQVQNIAPYRNWVIAAFRENMPFDQFTREQLAGDLLPEATQSQLIATGYNRLLQTTHEGGLQPKEYRAIYAADRVRNVSAVWLGATVGCAQCHDHKFDPYTMTDFYSLAAFFADVDDERHFTSGTNDNPTQREPELALPTAQQSQQVAEITARLEVLRADAATDSLPEEEQTQLRQRIQQAEAELKQVNRQIMRTMITVALPSPREVRVLPRGNWLDESGPLVTPAVPEFLGLLPSVTARPDRLDLANWLVDAEDGVGLLTARVMVNRLWALCFGTGLAADLADFGGQGEPPVHPELLDFLAHEFVDSGWDMRALMKHIVLSRTYQQSSIARPELAIRDPNNRLCARQSAFRLPAEMIRDNALAISGLLVTDLGGPSVKPYQPEGYYRHLNFPQRSYQQDNDARQWRRGVYVHWQRQFLHPMLKAFDAPSREECTAQRPQSNTPLAALTLLNDPTFVEAARVFAEQVLTAGLKDDAARLRWAFEECVTRPPSEAESVLLLRFLDKNRADFAARPQGAMELLRVGLTPVRDEQDAAASVGPGIELTELAAWTALCRALLNLAETNTRN